MADFPSITAPIHQHLFYGQVIPAHPLALKSDGSFDERHQRALTRYYLAAGAGGLAVGVHTTQFAIRHPRHGLLKPVLQLAAETITDCDHASGRTTVRIAGICGPTPQALAEAQLARDLGYHAGLLSLAALPHASDTDLIHHAETVARILPIFGFYLQPAAGGRLLSAAFWRRFVDIPNLVGIKIAPFHRYQTLDVLRAVAESGRANTLALYTGNDDQIVLDLITPFEFHTPHGNVALHFSGGLLGHWACATRDAVTVLAQCQKARADHAIPTRLLTRATQITEANAALFDAAHGFAGCLPGIQYLLHRQGLLASPRCLDPHELLSPGQAELLDQLAAREPYASESVWVAAHRHTWLA
jgi:dihydrodipicolinate synthase/N-acetylneuraminate lyase